MSGSTTNQASLVPPALLSGIDDGNDRPAALRALMHGIDRHEHRLIADCCRRYAAHRRLGMADGVNITIIAPNLWRPATRAPTGRHVCTISTIRRQTRKTRSRRTDLESARTTRTGWCQAVYCYGSNERRRSHLNRQATQTLKQLTRPTRPTPAARYTQPRVRH